MISQIVASIAVVLTLGAVVISIRQNTSAQRVVSIQSITAAIAAINIPGSESPALGNALAAATKDWAGASRDERILSHYFLFSFFKLCEQVWFQHKAGALEKGQWTGWESSLLRFYHSPGVKEGWWPGRRVAYSPAFQTYLAQSAPPAWPGSTSLYSLFDGLPSPDPQRSPPATPESAPL